MLPLISIVVPVSSMANKLESFKLWTQSLDSKYQLIVVHDFKDKATGIELQDHIEKNLTCQTMFLEGKYGSPGSARNAGMQVALGEWIIFWDSDDLGYVDSLDKWLREKDLECKGQNRDLVVFRFSRLNLITTEVLDQGNWKNEQKKNEVFWLSQPGLWRCLIRREITKDLEFLEMLMGEDQVFLLDVLAKGVKPCFQDQIVYQYATGREGQATQSERAVQEMSISLKEIANRRDLLPASVDRAASILWIKLSISCIKKLSFKQKPAVVHEFLATVFSRPHLWKLLIDIKMQGGKL